jgi:TonB-dependent SusC/RagA subfamily outer membrane receptor
MATDRCSTVAVFVPLLLTLQGCGGGAAHTAREPAVAPPSVEAGDIDGRPVARTEELLVGRFPGVRVVEVPGGGIAVRVWGPSTFVGDNDPLYVVDGVPVHVTPGRGVDWLNPGDVASIRVLKDVSETAAYGARGGNGVVLITTKRGG